MPDPASLVLDPAVLVLDPAVLVLDPVVLVLHPEDINLIVFRETVKTKTSRGIKSVAMRGQGDHFTNRLEPLNMSRNACVREVGQCMCANARLHFIKGRRS